MKKVVKYLGFVISLIVLFLFVSCEKNIEYESPTYFYSTTKIQTINPIDSVGIMHNNALGYFLLNDSIVLDSAFLYIVDYFDSFADTTTMTTIDELYDFTDSSMFNFSISYVITNYLKPNGLVDSLQIEYLLELEDIIVNFNTLFGYNRMLSALESTLARDNSFANVYDKDVIWGAISIARYSGTFWYDYRDGILKQNNIRDTEPPEYEGTWIGKVTADVVG